MALVKCGECQKEISDKAESCPHCGNPINTINANSQKVEVVEVERTSKKWKKKSLWGVAFIIIGAMMLGSDLKAFGILLIILGFGKLIISSIGSWWTNG